jgi:hypothetical protein
VYFVSIGALNSSEYSVISSTFNSGSGIQESGSVGNNHALGEAVIPTIRTSSRFNLSSGLINALYTSGNESNQFRLVYNQSIQSEEDTLISIKLTGSERVNSYAVKDFPKNGTLTGVPPDLVYEPNNNFYGEDFFIFYGYIDGVKTEDAIFNINVINVNDPPKLEVIGVFLGNSEDQETSITYDSVMKNLTMFDAEYSNLNLIVNQVNSGKIYSEKNPPQDGKYSIGDGTVLKWRPEKDQFGVIDAFTLVVFDGEFYSEEVVFRISVEGVEDTPVVGNPLVDIEVQESAENILIDVTDLFYDADGGDIDYFVKDWGNKILLTPEIDGTILTIVLNKNANGKSIVEIGGESNGQIIYDEFEIKVLPKIDEEPFIVNDYWKGYYDGDIYMEINPPVRIWSFSTMENIIKSQTGNWKYQDDEVDPVLSNNPLIVLSGTEWDRVYFQDGASVRVQQQTTVELVIPEKKSGSDWAKRNNNYSFVFDIRVQYGFNQPVLNTIFGNDSNKSELWVNPFGAVGGQGQYSEMASLHANKWYRLIYIVDGEGGNVKCYVDENLKNSKTLQNMIDGRYSLGEKVKVGADHQIANKNYELRRVVYYDYALNSDQVNFLGLMSYEEFEVENSRGVGKGQTFVYLHGVRGAILEDQKPALFMTTTEEYALWNLQSSDDLLNWENYKVIETIKDDNADELFRTGHLLLDDTLNENQLFYRVLAVE